MYNYERYLNKFLGIAKLLFFNQIVMILYKLAPLYRAMLGQPSKFI